MIPFSALSLDSGAGSFVLDANAEKLASAPSFEGDSISETQAEEIFRFYGQHPYWTSEETDEPIHSPNVPVPEF